jgi:hypothetical protein
MFVAPTFSLAGTPALLQAGNFAQMFNHMIEVDQFMPLWDA